MTISRCGLDGAKSVASQLVVATDRVWPDERVYWLIEGMRRSPVLGERRIQKIAVLRGDKMAVYEEDKGAWNIEKDTPFLCPSFWEYSVEEVQYIADRARENKVPTEPEEPINLIAVWAKDLDEARAKQRHVSVSGSYFRKER